MTFAVSHEAVFHDALVKESLLHEAVFHEISTPQKAFPRSPRTADVRRIDVPPSFPERRAACAAD